MSASTALASIASIPNALVKRKIAALVGSIVADAAALHLEWVYDQDALEKTVGDKDPEFWPESKCPFYTRPNGAVSCYADEIVTALESMSKNSNKFVPSKIYEDIQSKFGAADSPYQIALNKRKDKKYPIDGPWINGGVIKFLENHQKSITPPGSPTCEDHDGIAIALPWIIQSCSSADLPWTSLKEGVEILSTNPMALSHYEVESTLLYGALHPDLVSDPIAKAKAQFQDRYPEIVDEIKAVENGKASGMTIKQLVKEFGLACSLPGSFQGALASIVGANSYKDAIRANIMAGGDSCSRGLIIGAYLGAKFGIEGIPTDWLDKVDNIEKILLDAKSIYS